jgi:hypothetical protein
MYSTTNDPCGAFSGHLSKAEFHLVTKKYLANKSKFIFLTENCPTKESSTEKDFDGEDSCGEYRLTSTKRI